MNREKKTCFFSAGIFNGFLGSFQSSDMCKYDSRSRAHIRLSNTILDMLFIGPYGVSRAINSILRLMAMIQTAQAIVTNCTFFMHISFVQFFFGFVSRTPVHVKALITLWNLYFRITILVTYQFEQNVSKIITFVAFFVFDFAWIRFVQWLRYDLFVNL